MTSLQIIPVEGIPEIVPGKDLGKVIVEFLGKNDIVIDQNDIIVIAQKIISKSENRFVNLNDIVPSKQALELAHITGKDPRLVECIVQESKSIIRAKENVIIAELHNGLICANAGIDRSNVPGEGNGEWVLLLPLDADKSARRIKEKIHELTEKNIGVLIIDSHGRPWRFGTVGISIGMAGIPSLVDLRGKKDRNGYVLQSSVVAAVDELAAAASLVMGQSDESVPVVLIKGFPYSGGDGSIKDLIRPEENDLFR